ncbi:MAG TPA: potassium transporter Kup [Gemmatimonadaceae bacterium]|nr:potassium transporter Kup [Gemmatimonadaceae bacterium]
MSTHPEANPSGGRLARLTLLAIGVVYGDIGTSPLYAIRECFKEGHGMAVTPANVYGVLSLIVWALIIVVSVKYIAFILRADNRGEGGELALLALILQQTRREGDSRRRFVIIALGLIGASLLYGDGAITPAMSVLGATEGLEVITPRFRVFIVPVTVIILLSLFMVQKKGTAKVGRVFGPVMIVWFIVIATLGIRELIRSPGIVAAVNPMYAVRFFMDHGFGGMLILGSVVLVITGAEALYADMGHFGRRPIRVAWFALVLPALLLNYFGQAALILREPAAAANPFYLLAPRVLLYPMIALATMAAIIASQALISGAFSITQQCVQLGYSPRVTIVHTSETEHGQIYIPEVNKALMIGCLLIVVGFRSTSNLGAAYGIAVTGSMAITTILFATLARTRWSWAWPQVIGIGLLFLIVDLSFFGSNAIKLKDGGWVPLAIALVIFTLMTTWNRGRRIVQDLLAQGSLPLDLFLNDVAKHKPYRVPGTAVFMTSNPDGAPLVLLHHLKHNKVLHEHVILLSILSANVPQIPDNERIEAKQLGEGFSRVTARYGFMETADVPAVLASCKESGIRAEPRETTYYLGRERLLPHGQTKLAGWRKKLYVFMSRNSRTATEYFNIPPNRVVKLGAQIEF